jgi:hypothetical protein
MEPINESVCEREMVLAVTPYIDEFAIGIVHGGERAAADLEVEIILVG